MQEKNKFVFIKQCVELLAMSMFSRNKIFIFSKLDMDNIALSYHILEIGINP